MIDTEDVQKALDYLRFERAKAAKSRADRIYIEEYRKTLKSLEMQKHVEKPLAAQEREAYASPAYQAHLEALREAVEADEFHRWGMVAAQAIIEAWRTQEATKRGEGKLG
jgi:hypothetical protein